MADHIYGSSYDAFIASSIAQLKDKVPEIYWEALHRKLENEVSIKNELLILILATFHTVSRFPFCTCSFTSKLI